MPDPLKIRILCSECGNLLTGPPPCGRHLGIEPGTALDGSGDRLRQCESVEFEAYIPLRFVPEELVEELRAKELEFNAKGGLRKLTEEEIARTPPLEDIELEDKEPVEPELDEVPDELPDGLRPGFG